MICTQACKRCLSSASEVIARPVLKTTPSPGGSSASLPHPTPTPINPRQIDSVCEPQALFLLPLSLHPSSPQPHPSAVSTLSSSSLIPRQPRLARNHSKTLPKPRGTLEDERFGGWGRRRERKQLFVARLEAAGLFAASLTGWFSALTNIPSLYIYIFKFPRSFARVVCLLPTSVR